MEKEKKTISCSYALPFIIMFAVMCFLCSYIYIDRKLNEGISSTVVKTDCIDSVCNCNHLDYKDVAGLYSADFNFEMEYYDGSKEVENAKYSLYLYTDGTFYYHIPTHVNHGIVGNYTISVNYITLNGIFQHGGDIGMGVEFSSKKLEFDDSKNLIDEQPTANPIDSSFATLVKKKDFTDADNENSKVKEMYTITVLYNGNEG